MTRHNLNRRGGHRRQQGITVVVVLVLLSVMLVGALSLARMSEVGTLAAGNLATREASLLASEAGVSRAFSSVKALVDIDNDAGTWYFATRQATNATTGLPVAGLDSAPEVKVDDRYSVRYLVERMCEVKKVTEPMRECLVKRTYEGASKKATDEEELAPNAGIQYRVTVRVTDQRGTTTWVQALVTKGI